MALEVFLFRSAQKLKIWVNKQIENLSRPFLINFPSGCTGGGGVNNFQCSLSPFESAMYPLPSSQLPFRHYWKQKCSISPKFKLVKISKSSYNKCWPKTDSSTLSNSLKRTHYPQLVNSLKLTTRSKVRSISGWQPARNWWTAWNIQIASPDQLHTPNKQPHTKHYSRKVTCSLKIATSQNEPNSQ